MPASGKVVYETGLEPEYAIDDFGSPEYLKDGSVRIPVCTEWKGALKTECYVRISRTTLAELGHRCIQIAEEARDENSIWVAAPH